MTALLSRAGDGPSDPSPTTKVARRIAARTHAASAGTAIDRRPRADARADDAIVDDSPEVTVVVPFGLFDAHAEARRIW